MIIIEKGKENLIDVTVSERAKSDGPLYLFVFKNLSTKEISMCFSDNLSTNRERYDRFLIKEKEDPNILKGEIELSAGFFSYKIFEKSNTNFIVTEADNMLERGLLRVVFQREQPKFYTSCENEKFFYKKY